MNSKKEDGLYNDLFLSIMSWVNSAAVTLIVGGVFAVAVGLATHWLFGAIIAGCVVILALASYIVFKK
jgi:amino acid transporter